MFISAWAQYPQIAENILPVVKKVGTIGELRCVVTMQDKNKVRSSESAVFSSVAISLERLIFLALLVLVFL